MKTCSKCKISKCIELFSKDKSSKRGVRSDCKACVKEYLQSDKYKKWRKQYLQSDRYKKNSQEYGRKYWRRRRTADPLYKLKGNLRALIWNNFHVRQYKKASKTHELLGADFLTVQQHLIDSAIRNYGKYFPARKYHIDHIMPCASATNEAELITLQHYTNLQFLYPKDNLVKNDNVNFTPIKR